MLQPLFLTLFLTGRISLDFSLLSLYSQPVIVDVEDVFILASPLGDMAYDPEREAARTIAIKNKLLAEIEKNAQGQCHNDYDNDKKIVFI